MQENNRTLITIITESSLETTLSRELEKIGVHGYTITDARGKGGRGSRKADWDADSNIRVEVICTEVMAKAITDLLQKKYYDDFAMITYSHDVFVLRPEKFT
ncbi:MAG: transcriptional regulator [Hahellaceae bacterium]|jgi:nitrogen regulatory protein PII|nr:transcriptional regulator [Hahellaceae bacterium]MCP5210923.1 transcriptional regulator [Hahellaceae bacterium]